MPLSDFENKACLCSFVQTINPIKQTIIGAVDTAISTLTLVKAFLQLIPLSPEDQLKKVAYQAELEFEEMRVRVVEAPFARITSICKAFSDCPPVSNAATVFKGARDYLLGDVDARKNQIANYIEQLNDERLKIERIDNWIDALNSFKDALDACGDL